MIGLCGEQIRVTTTTTTNKQRVSQKLSQFLIVNITHFQLTFIVEMWNGVAIPNKGIMTASYFLSTAGMTHDEGSRCSLTSWCLWQKLLKSNPAKGPVKQFQHLFNISSTFVEALLHQGCWKHACQTVSTWASTNVELMLDWCLNRLAGP